jgi:hypothetical protein
MSNDRLLALALAGAALWVGWSAPQPAPPMPPPPPPLAPIAPAPKPKAPPRRPWLTANPAPVGAARLIGETELERGARRLLKQRRHLLLTGKPNLPVAKRRSCCPSDCRCGLCECECPCKQGRPCGGSGCTCIAIEEGDPAVDLLAVPGRKRNIASKGLGCCVFRSLEYSAAWQNVPQLAGFPEWMVQNGVAGGGFPKKVDQLIPRISADRGMPPPRYLQYEGGDPSIIELALKTGRLPCVTWQGNHMLNCVYLDATKGAIVDNNAPERVQWFSRQVFISKWKQGGGGWVAVLLAPSPPPVPRNLARQRVREAADAAPPAHGLFGMEWLPNGGVPRWSLSGVPCSEADAVSAVLADDSRAPHLTVIGPEAERSRVLADLDAAPALAPWRGLLRVQSYAPDSWALAVGFATDGRPTIYYQCADGRVLFRMSDYAGPDALASALRRADPNYNPASDPSGRPALPGLPFDPAKVPMAAWGLGAAALYFLMRKDRSDAAPR